MTGVVNWSGIKYSADLTTPFEVAKVGASVELPTSGSPSVKGYWNDKEASLTMTAYPSTYF